MLLFGNALESPQTAMYSIRGVPPVTKGKGQFRGYLPAHCGRAVDILNLIRQVAAAMRPFVVCTAAASVFIFRVLQRLSVFRYFFGDVCLHPVQGKTVASRWLRREVGSRWRRPRRR